MNATFYLIDKQTIYIHNIDYQISKIYNTKRKNNSFNQSKPEIEMIQKLRLVYPDLKTQWKNFFK